MLTRLLFPLSLLALSAAAQAPDSVEVFAEEHGLRGWSHVDELRYTFNVSSSRGETHRSWIWWPHEGTITRQVSGEDDVTFTHGEITGGDDDPLVRADRQFINDQYWLVFPLHLVWDGDVTVTDDGQQPAPFDLGALWRITADYGDEGGYTPGDVYELYVEGESRLVRAWVFRAGGTGAPRPMLWGQPRRLGPLVIYLEHSNPDTGTRLWFSDVSVVVDGVEVTPSVL